MSSVEGEDAQLRVLVRRLTPTVRRRVLYAAIRSPETLTEEIWTLAALCTIKANLIEG